MDPGFSFIGVQSHFVSCVFASGMCRSAALDAVDSQMQAVGIPSFVLDCKDDFLGRYFFVELVRRRPPCAR